MRSKDNWPKDLRFENPFWPGTHCSACSLGNGLEGEGWWEGGGRTGEASRRALHIEAHTALLLSDGERGSLIGKTGTLGWGNELPPPGGTVSALLATPQRPSGIQEPAASPEHHSVAKSTQSGQRHQHLSINYRPQDVPGLDIDYLKAFSSPMGSTQ